MWRLNHPFGYREDLNWRCRNWRIWNAIPPIFNGFFARMLPSPSPQSLPTLSPPPSLSPLPPPLLPFSHSSKSKSKPTTTCSVGFFLSFFLSFFSSFSFYNNTRVLSFFLSFFFFFFFVLILLKQIEVPHIWFFIPPKNTREYWK